MKNHIWTAIVAAVALLYMGIIWFRDRYKFWAVIHNLIAHPLLIISDAEESWPSRFHDWTADKMWEANREDMAEEGWKLTECCNCDRVFPRDNMFGVGVQGAEPTLWACKDCIPKVMEEQAQKA